MVSPLEACHSLATLDSRVDQVSPPAITQKIWIGEGQIWLYRAITLIPN